MDNITIVAETKRLILQEHQISNVNWLFDILGDAETMAYYPRPYTKEEVGGWIDKNLDRYQKDGFGLWALWEKEKKTFVGQCGITMQNIDGEMVPEIGYHINKKHWRQGYASEAANACLELGNTKYNFESIYIHTYVKNLPSIAVAKHLGMKYLKSYDKVVNKEGLLWMHMVYRHEYS